MDVLKLLLLIITANAAPVLLHTLFGKRLSLAIDGGRKFFDGRPVFGSSKTVRGLIGSLLCTILVAELLAMPVITGLLIACGAMMGDLASSFIKRRVGMKPSTQAMGLDQIPEALLPLLLVMDQQQLTMPLIITLTLVFTALEMSVSPLLHKLHLRKTPY